MRTLLISLLLGVLVTGRSAPSAKAQSRASVFGWEQHLHRGLLNRSGGFGGRFYERGLFRTVTREMDYEYDLDLFTYRFDPFDDYRWHQADNAFRSFAGSIDYGEFATESRLKSTVNVSGQGQFGVIGVQQEDLRATRYFFQVGYVHQWRARHRIGARHTLGANKADLDLMLAYRWGDDQVGWVEAELDLLDWPSNIVHSLITNSNRDFDVVQRYARLPMMGVIRAVAPSHPFLRAELVAGYQPTSEAIITRQAAPDSNFVNTETVHYFGLLVEYHQPTFSVGLTARRTFARMERHADGSSRYALDFGNRERTNRLGLYATYTWAPLQFQQWVWVEQNRDQLLGPTVPDTWSPFHYRGIRTMAKSRITVGQSGGLWGGLELNVDHRNVRGEKEGNTINLPFRRNYPDQVTPNNQRLTAMVGYQYRPRVRITMGASVDLDGDLYSGWGIPSQNRDEASRFDGGFIRMALDW